MCLTIWKTSWDVSTAYLIVNLLVSPKLDLKGTVLELTIKSLFLLVLANFLRAAYGDPGYVHLMNFVYNFSICF